MKSEDILTQGMPDEFPDEVERAKYWADLLYKAVDKHDIYLLAKRNLDTKNKNSLKSKEARKILEEAIKRYEEIHNLRLLYVESK